MQIDKFNIMKENRRQTGTKIEEGEKREEWMARKIE